MYVATFTFDASKALIGSVAVKNKVLVYCLPVSMYKEEKGIRVSFVIVLHPDYTEQFVKDLRATKRMIHCNFKHNLIMGQILEPDNYHLIYHPEIIHLRPWLIDGETGMETFVIGSWKYSYITRIADMLKKKHVGKMVSNIKRGMPSEFFVVDIIPKMTSRQREALELAIRHGYYNRPRKCDLYDLADIMGVKYPTFQAHFTKAEHKLIPHLANWKDDKKKKGDTKKDVKK